MAINKMTFTGVGGIDLTGDTAVETDVASGKIFHKADGTQAVGTAQVGVDTFTDYIFKTHAGYTYENLEVTQVPSYAFAGAKNIKAVNMPNVTTLDPYAFYNNKITNLNFPKVTNLNHNVFAYSITKKVDLPLVTSIDEYCFSNCSYLEEVNAPLATTIRDYAFQYCGQYSTKDYLTFENVTTVRSNAFRQCDYKTINLPSLVTLGYMAFYYSQIEEFTVPATVTSQIQSVFGYCTKLRKLTFLNDNVKLVYSGNFTNCNALEEMSFLACTSVPPIASREVLSGVPTTCIIKVPAALETEWKQATNWSTYASQIVGV